MKAVLLLRTTGTLPGTSAEVVLEERWEGEMPVKPSVGDRITLFGTSRDGFSGVVTEVTVPFFRDGPQGAWPDFIVKAERKDE